MLFRSRFSTLAGERVFVSADDRFSSLFASFAASALPVRIWRYGNGQFVDVTRRFRATIAADAARLWRGSQHARRAGADARGLFAAWAADTCALGKKTTVLRELARAVAAGAFSPPRAEAGPAGRSYAAALRGKLRTWGYCR